MKFLVALLALTASALGVAKVPDTPLPGPVQVNPKFIDFAYEPELRKVPGIDFLGWGYDATYRDQFYALKPALFLFSYNNNPKGSEKFYQYPIDDEQFAVPDQVFIRTVGKTVTDTYISLNSAMDRFRLDLKLNLKVSTGGMDASLAVGIGIVNKNEKTKRIVRSYAETELYQLYLGKKFLTADLEYDMTELAKSYPFNPSNDKSRAAFYLFLSTWGTHFVDSVSVGGSVQSVTQFEHDGSLNLFKLTVAIAGKMSSFEGSLDLELSTEEEKIKEETTANSIIMGGDAKFADFVLAADNPASARLLYESWKSSLMDNPVAVRFRLIEIWQLWPTLLNDPNMGETVCKAISNFLGFDLEDPNYCKGVPEVLSSYVRTGGLFKGETNAF